MSLSKYLKDYHTFQCKPNIAVQKNMQFIVIFKQKQITSQQQQSIKQIFKINNNYAYPIGGSRKDYQMIQQAIIQQLQQKYGNNIKTNIFLIADLPAVKQILQSKQKNQTLVRIRQIYLIHNQQQNGQVLKLRQKYKNINNNFNKLQGSNGVLPLIRKLMKFSKIQGNILNNFNRFGDEKYMKKSYIAKNRYLGCINLSKLEYIKYFQQFQKALYLYIYCKNRKMTVLDGNITQEIQKAYTLLINSNQQQKLIRQSNKIILSLYQQDCIFYQFINRGLLNFSKKKFDWRVYALPLHLLFNAIKYEYRLNKDTSKWSQFFQKGQCILWRAGKISPQELQQLKTINKHLYFELMSFTSTSLDPNVVYQKFLDEKQYKQNCIMKITMKRPQNKQQIQIFPFLYLSFALMNDKKVNEKQVLINALTIAKLKKISETNYQKICINKFLKKKFQKIPSKISIPIIELEIGSFQDEIINYNVKNQLLKSKQQKQLMKNYLYMLEAIKKYKKFDIGCSLILSGEMQAAYQFNKDKLQQIQNRILLQQQKCEVYKQNIDDQDKLKQNKIELIKQAHQLNYQLSNVCLELNMEKQALKYIEKSINQYKMIQEIDDHLSFREHQQYLNKMYEQTTDIFRHFDHITEANEVLLKQIQVLKVKAKQNSDLQQVCYFQIAQLQISLGVINFKEGNISQADQYFQSSKKRIQQIMVAINYQSLKNQTFYFGFIFQYLTNSQVTSSQQYFQSRRAKNIAQATYIFGGQQKFQKVKANSTGLKAQLQKFMTQNAAKIRKDQDEKLMFYETTKISQDEKKQIGIPIMQKLQAVFADNEQLSKIQPMIEDYFNEFHESINMSESDPNNIIRQKKENILRSSITQSINYSEIQDEKIENQLNEILQTKLSEWTAASQNSVLQQSAMDIKNKMDEIILQSKQKFIKQLKKKSQYKNYKLYCQRVCRSIQKYLSNWFRINNNDRSISHHFMLIQYYQDSDNFKKQIDAIQKLIKSTINNENLIYRFIEGNILKIKFYFNLSDYNFILLLQKINILTLSNIKRQKQQKLFKCGEILQQVLQQINRYDKTLLVKNMRQNETRVMSRSNIYERVSGKNLQLNKNRLQKLQYYKLYLNIWQQKIKLNKFQCDINKKNAKQQKQELKKIQLEISKLKHKSAYLQKIDCMKIQSIIKQMSGQILIIYLQLQRKKEQKYFINSFKIMKQSYQLIKNIKDINQQMNILTKIYFIFYKQSQQFIKQLTLLLKQYQSYKNYSSYWKILLSNHFLSNKLISFNSININSSIVNMGSNYYYQCLMILKNNQFSILKYNVLQEYGATFSKSKIIRKSSIRQNIISNPQSALNLYINISQQNNLNKKSNINNRIKRQNSFRINIDNKLQKSNSLQNNSSININIDQQQLQLPQESVILKKKDNRLKSSFIVLKKQKYQDKLLDQFDKRQNSILQINTFDTQQKKNNLSRNKKEVIQLIQSQLNDRQQ